jgi:hypothetical protein
MCLIQQTAVTARATPKNYLVHYVCLRVDTPAATRQHPHAAKTTRNPAAAFGDRWPRLVLEHRVIGAHPRPNLVAITVVGLCAADHGGAGRTWMRGCPRPRADSWDTGGVQILQTDRVGVSTLGLRSRHQQQM